jgi:serine/threonine protein kinase
MVSLSAGFVAFVVGTAVTLVVPVLLMWVVFKVFQGLFYVLGGVGRLLGGGARRVGRFVQGEVVDTLHLAGGVVTAGVILPLSLANVLIGRLAAARHYGRALEDEVMSSLVSLYRIALGHPTRLLGLGVLTEGVERKIPDLVARAPRTGSVPARKPAKAGFAGYVVQREMPAGGSGARLFVAKPTADKASELAARGYVAGSDVVIKCFDRSYGSTLPQIVRESRALEAAKRLGHVLEHSLDEERFHYVMPFVPGDDLDVVTRRLHAAGGERGLDRRALAKVLGYASDLCTTLERFHGEGLWHKDIKPTNLLVAGDRLQVVDLGLVTPLASALTLTTHGTEYFRDPELVRLAVRGVKVHEVDGVKFDIYSAGAVLFSMLENSFPAHGSLSRLTKPVPDALAWIVRRAMSDVSQRYASARAMGRDLAVLLAASDPFAVRPAELPSFTGGADEPLPRAALAAHTTGDGVRPSGTSERAPKIERHERGSNTSAVPASASTVRRTHRRRTAGAFALVAMMVCIAGGVFAVHAERQSHPMYGRSAQVMAAPHARASASSSGVRVHTFYGPNQPAVVQIESSTGAAPLDVPTEPHAGRVLVYVDPRVTEPTSTERFVQQVREIGFEPVGLGTSAEDIDWLAGVDRIIGNADLGDATTVGRLERWLALREGELAAVLWLGPGSCDGAVASHLVAPDPAARRQGSVRGQPLEATSSFETTVGAAR